jgi:hypothetical protein
MIGYYTFLSSGINITNVIWSEPYLDATLNVQTVTAVLPVYVPKLNS